MKTLIISFLFTCIRLSSFAQDSTVTLSPFEVFLSQPGRMIKTTFMMAGDYGPATVVKFTATDLHTDSRMKSLRLDFPNLNYERPLVFRTSLYLDSAQVDTAIHVLETFLKQSQLLLPAANMHFTYRLSTDVRLSADYLPYKGSWTFSVDKVYKHLGTAIFGSEISFNQRRLGNLIEILQRAKESW